tara:strand:+ start:531 stop:824 length:294 start_codon:yes stop_codon:yes gene_type:complete
MEYILVLIAILLISIFLDHKYHTKLYDSRKERILIPIVFLILGSIWDTFAIWRGHWSFSGSGLIGIKIGLMPLEEYLFMLIIPYAILTHYKALRKEI